MKVKTKKIILENVDEQFVEVEGGVVHLAIYLEEDK